MQAIGAAKTASGLGLVLVCCGLGACHTASPTVTGSLPGRKPALVVSDAERDCLGRAMYFESNRSDAEGLLAVGTVVMNRVEAATAPGGICEVVGQPRQFASGVLTKPMREKDLGKIADVADAVLAGERHPKVGRAMHFHTARRSYPYNNMHYVAVAGGNAFYERRKPGAAEPETAPATVLAYAAAGPAQARIQAPQEMARAAASPVQAVAAPAAPAETLPEGPARDICKVAAGPGAHRHG